MAKLRKAWEEHEPRTDRGRALWGIFKSVAGPEARKSLESMNVTLANRFDSVGAAASLDLSHVDDDYERVAEDDGSVSVMYCVKLFVSPERVASYDMARVALDMQYLTPDCFDVDLHLSASTPAAKYGLAVFTLWCEYRARVAPIPF